MKKKDKDTTRMEAKNLLNAFPNAFQSSYKARNNPEVSFIMIYLLLAENSPAFVIHSWRG
jgi:hypothetical protein